MSSAKLVALIRPSSAGAAKYSSSLINIVKMSCQYLYLPLFMYIAINSSIAA